MNGVLKERNFTLQTGKICLIIIGLLIIRWNGKATGKKKTESSGPLCPPPDVPTTGEPTQPVLVGSHTVVCVSGDAADNAATPQICSLDTTAAVGLTSGTGDLVPESL
mgnify:CR=1 FL=1